MDHRTSAVPGNNAATERDNGIYIFTPLYFKDETIRCDATESTGTSNAASISKMRVDGETLHAAAARRTNLARRKTPENTAFFGFPRCAPDCPSQGLTATPLACLLLAHAEIAFTPRCGCISVGG
jgi:hypothetical protein